MKKLPKINTSKLLKAALPYILVGLMATKLGQAYRMASGGDVLDRIFGAFLKIGEAFTNPLPSLHPFDLLVGAACGALLWFMPRSLTPKSRCCATATAVMNAFAWAVQPPFTCSISLFLKCKDRFVSFQTGNEPQNRLY